MENPASGNLDINQGGHMCYHLAESDDYDLVRQFTGDGIAYNLLCHLCAKNLDNLGDLLRAVSEEQFRATEGYCEQVIGQPEVFERASNLSFAHQVVKLQQPLQERILSIKPERGVKLSRWIAILVSGQIAQIDLAHGSAKPLVKVPQTDLVFSDKVTLHLSPQNRFAAVVNEREASGVVIDLETGYVTMPLNRGSYHPEQTPFPAVFFQSDDRILLVHGTDWNRLDISDPQTGQLLTDRNPTSYGRGEPRPEHYLDYFHGLPVISPDVEWIIENGWIWGPAGISRLWSLRRWITKNSWESEDGDSVKYLTFRHYHWNAPLCWVDNKTIGIWGFGDDDLAMTPAVQLFNAETGERFRWFAGPKEGALYFDQYLFSTSKEGTDVWDIDTGERLLHEPDLTPIDYHPETHQFLSPLSDDKFQLSQLEG